MQVSVVVPSFGRAAYLKNCMKALEKQSRPPDEIIVVCRSTDLETLAFGYRWQKEHTGSRKTVVEVSQPGQIAALRAGHAAASGEIVAFTDDDTEPHVDWIERLIQYYTQDSIGGVGGRDLIHGMEDVPGSQKVGQLTWYGRLIGNHHCGVGRPRDVHVLKGANASFRTKLVEFPDFFRGSGAEVHNEVYVCFRIRHFGYRLVYDPNILVDHYPAPRAPTDQRGSIQPSHIADASFNFSSSAMLFLPFSQRIIRFLYALCVGDRCSPGLLRLMIGWLSGEEEVIRAFMPTQRGHLAGVLFRYKSLHRLKTIEQREVNGVHPS